MRIGSQPGNLDFDPAFFAGNSPTSPSSSRPSNRSCSSGPDFVVQPVLATKWETTDRKVWKFTLRDGVTFSNGATFTADDVVYTMKRLHGPQVPGGQGPANIETMTADDPTHVTFTLKVADDRVP